MKEFYISKLSEYLSAIERLKSYYPNTIFTQNPVSISFLYRGLSNANYELLPGLFRKKKIDYDNEGHFVENDIYLKWGTELSILQSFILEASGILSLNTSDLTRWAEYAQHYGVPTRFLDWSKNPLVALYFACCNNQDQNGKVWLLHARNYTYSFPKQTDENREKTRYEMIESMIKENKGFDYPLLYTPYYVDQRMSAQSSYFMVWGTKQEKLETLLDDEKYSMVLPEEETGIRTFGEHQKEALLFPFFIRANKKSFLLNELNTVGINEKTLFPGLDGIGKYVERTFRYNYSDSLYHI